MKRYPSTNPRFMPPISPPGQREYRKLTMREEIFRVLLLMGAQCFIGMSIIILFYLDLAIIGPIVGVVSGLFIIIYTARFVRWTDRQTRYLFAPIFVVLISVWLYTGYDLCQSFWMASILTHLHLMAKGAILLMSIGVKAIYGWGMYILWIEMTDPNWPSPRQAVLRDGPYIPGFSTETYGGQVLPAVSTIASLPSRTITVQLDKNGDGKHTESVSHIPDTTNWQKFAWAVAHHGKGFTEATAKAYSVPLNDVKDQVGQLIVVGMRTVREQFIARGWLEWRNPTVHERGLRVTPKGQRVLEAIGKEN